MRLVDMTVHIPSMLAKAPQDAATSRWTTAEFRIYVAIACVTLPVMAWIPIALSSSSNPNYDLYKHRLSPGWIPHRQVVCKPFTTLPLRFQNIS